MSLSKLPLDWQDWLREAVAQGCAPRDLIAEMLKAGFAPDLAHQALAETVQSGPAPAGDATLKTGGLIERPDILSESHVIDIDGHPIYIVAELDTPRVVVVANVLTAAECDTLVALAEARLTESTVVDVQTGESVTNAERTGRLTFFHHADHPLVASVQARLEVLAGWPHSRFEGLQVVRYGVGNQYRPHYDWFDPALPGMQRHLATGGQRVGTFVLYLSHVAGGGGTSFPNIGGLTVRPQKGGAVFFANITALGEPDHLTKHAGDPVERGVKWIATQWLRERSFQS